MIYDVLGVPRLLRVTYATIFNEVFSALSTCFRRCCLMQGFLWIVNELLFDLHAVRFTVGSQGRFVFHMIQYSQEL